MATFYKVTVGGSYEPAINGAFFCVSTRSDPPFGFAVQKDLGYHFIISKLVFVFN